MANKQWVIMIGRTEDGQWSIHIPEVDLDRQIEHLDEIKKRAGRLVALLAGVHRNDVTVRFHNVSPEDNIGDGGVRR